MKKTNPREGGLTILFTGLPSSGKSTLAHTLAKHIENEFSRRVTLLDGDEIRKLLCSGLGYSKEDRCLNILRNAFVAAQVTRHGGIAICALIAPFAEVRNTFRRWVEAEQGTFLEIYVATALDVCEKRDIKGLYAKARAGEIRGMTGIDDPYEVPEDPDLLLDTGGEDINQSFERLLAWLQSNGYLAILRRKK
ncbi:MAG: adenylyl-sulfate kinase [Gammaproteobacteria bacterium]|nr:adenylyl-sulfate kinase [Gammaproteobacteria bacterium]